MSLRLHGAITSCVVLAFAFPHPRSSNTLLINLRYQQERRAERKGGGVGLLVAHCRRQARAEQVAGLVNQPRLHLRRDAREREVGGGELSCTRLPGEHFGVGEPHEAPEEARQAEEVNATLADLQTVEISIFKELRRCGAAISWAG